VPLPLLWPQDPTKVDRSGAYIARQAAKSVVAAGLARRCLVQVSYAIGVPEPLSVFVDTYQTGTIPDKDILAKGGWGGGVGCGGVGWGVHTLGWRAVAGGGAGSQQELLSSAGPSVLPHAVLTCNPPAAPFLPAPCSPGHL
jgi:hypothetical protein